MHRYLFNSLLSTAVALCGANAFAVTIQPNEAVSKDVFVYQFLANQNFNNGNDGQGFGSILSAGETGTGHGTQSLLQFDLSTVGLTSAQVTGATINLHASDTAAAGFGLSPDAAHPIQIDIFAVGGPAPTWDEATVGYGTLPSTTGVLISTATIPAINQTYSFDVTGLVKQWLSGALPNNGVLITQRNVVAGDLPATFHVGVFDSAGAVTLSSRPSLTVVPEPSSLLLIGLGLPWLVYRVRRARAV